LFKASYSVILSSWILDYYQEFGAAPGEVIQDIYLDKKRYVDSEDDASLISTFLQSLSKEYVTKNVEYSVSQAIEYLKERSLRLLSEDITAKLNANQLLEAEESVGTYTRVEQQKIRGVRVLTDTQEVYVAFNRTEEVLFKLPGAFGECVGPFCRGDFISFLGFAKRGKSHAMNYAEEAAISTAGLTTVLFSLEMTKRQNMRRKWMSFTGRPLSSRTVQIPYFEETEGDSDKKWSIQYYEEHREGFPHELKDIEKLQKQVTRYIRSDDPILIALPARSATVRDLEMHLTNLESYENIVPDVVFVDYADLLLGPPGKDYRHQIDDIWANLRKIALERNICVVTASQSNRYTATNDVEEDSVAEDIRKMAHVTRMIGINQSKKDREAQVIRFRTLVDREGLSRFDEVLALQCQPIGRFVVDSRLLSEVEYEKEEPKKKHKSGGYS
jgi:hypothetical protein